jgi:hypothetical protein
MFTKPKNTEILTMKLPFEAATAEIASNPELFVDAVFSCLDSEFLILPRGTDFVAFPVFEAGYEALKKATAGFTNLTEVAIFSAIQECPISFVVVRAMLGFTPPEWAYIASQQTKSIITQGQVRSLDKKIRSQPLTPLRCSPDSLERLHKLVAVAVALLQQGMPEVSASQLHRLDKADTQNGSAGIRNLALFGVPYAMLLYERFLGRPFAGHRDSVSDLIGNGLEFVIEEILTGAGISFRKTKRAERISGFDQTPDFIIPNEFNPQIVIEAKICEDDGTARDKVTRIQHLGNLSQDFARQGKTGFEVIACIGGRGFGVRREDMKKMLLATNGKVFTLKTIGKMVAHTRLAEYATKTPRGR